jgi:repressor LexA
MPEAGIVDDDLFAIEYNTTTKPGDIVLACADNELTVKTLPMDAEGRW